MASIIELIKNIRNARLGKDVRESIASAIEQTYEDATKDGNANMEVSEARGTFGNLSQRLNNSDIVKASRKEVATANNNLQNQINGLASGSPLVASSVSEMTDTSHIYVNTTDGHWYYYNGTAWTDGGIYQSTGIANKSITYDRFADDINESFKSTFYPYNFEIIDNKFLGDRPTYELSDSNGYMALKLDVTGLKKIYITTKYASTSIRDCTFFDTNNERVKAGTCGPIDVTNKEITVPSNASFAIVNYNKIQGEGITPSINGLKYIVEGTPELYNLSDELINRIANKQFGPLDKGYICFVSDDGHDTAITNTLPIIQNKNIPWTFACWTESQIITDATKRQQIINLINNYSCAICQHGAGSFVNCSKEELVNYLRSEKAKWEQLNINVNGLCYPNHDHNNNVMAICGSMFNVCGTGGPASNPLQHTKVLYPNDTNGARTNMYELFRISLYSTTLNNLKASVDYAYNNKKLLILFTHDDDVIGDQKTKLENIIDYAKQIGIEFTTINDLDKII